MRFVPKTEHEIASENLLPDGTYGFEIIEAEDTVSKSSGKDMIHVKMKVFDGNGGHKLVDDYLMEAMLYKLKHCMDACGLSDEYARGTVEGGDLVGKVGEVRIITQQDKDKMYPPRNSVKDYVAPKAGAVPAKQAARKPAMAGGVSDPFDDEIPF